jgi:hypothetical protein
LGSIVSIFGSVGVSPYAEDDAAKTNRRTLASRTRRQVNHVVSAVAGRLHRCQVGDAADPQIDFAARACQVLLLARRKIVQHGHRMPAARQLVHDVGADEPGAACDQVAHSNLLPAQSRTWKKSPLCD